MRIPPVKSEEEDEDKEGGTEGASGWEEGRSEADNVVAAIESVLAAALALASGDSSYERMKGRRAAGTVQFMALS